MKFKGSEGAGIMRIFESFFNIAAILHFRDGQDVYTTYESCKQQAQQNELDVTAWDILNSGDVPDEFKVSAFGLTPRASTGGKCNS